ncbi:MAG: hypothetical protein QXG00_07150 [Candidatus Woesearchaeota archaeon]
MNHIQGDAPSSINIGLYFEDMLVSLMTFSKSRFDKNIKWELIRYCTLNFYNVIGGFSKLLSYFIKHNNGSILSFSDRRFSIGNVYKKNGFRLYLIQNQHIIISKNLP